MAKKKVIIIGGGMAGLFAAWNLAKEGVKVTLLERNSKVGKKILATGNGRCNITNQQLEESRYHSETKNLYPSTVQVCHLDKTKALLYELGIDLVSLENGKMYPRSMKAASVVKALLYACEEMGVDIHYDARVTSMHYESKYKVNASERTYYAPYVIIATGGKSYSDSGSSGDGYKLAKAFGHHIVTPKASIVQLHCSGLNYKALKGIKTVGRVGLVDEKGQLLREDTDEILFTDYGLSGPSILQISSHVEPLLSSGAHLWVTIDLFPSLSFEQLDNLLMERFTRFAGRSVLDSFVGFMELRLIQGILTQMEVSIHEKAGNITKKIRQQLVSQLKGMKEQIIGTHLWNQAQVTKGGVSCLEVDEASLESLKSPGLFFAGEVLDMDGDCGGFNLQFAMSSSYVIAQAIIESE